jgi:hypothetical protein
MYWTIQIVTYGGFLSIEIVFAGVCLISAEPESTRFIHRPIVINTLECRHFEIGHTCTQRLQYLSLAIALVTIYSFSLDSFSKVPKKDTNKAPYMIKQTMNKSTGPDTALTLCTSEFCYKFITMGSVVAMDISERTKFRFRRTTYSSA